MNLDKNLYNLITDNTPVMDFKEFISRSSMICYGWEVSLKSNPKIYYKASIFDVYSASALIIIDNKEISVPFTNIDSIRESINNNTTFVEN